MMEKELPSQAEENYLKAIFKISELEDKPASTNAIAGQLSTTPAAVSDMLKRLAGKKLVHYKRHHGATLTDSGNQVATSLIRKHRLWEVFLYNVLKFSWDEVHEMAEQLEHIHSHELIDRLDHFLGHPKFDPHGDPIPDAKGHFTHRKQIELTHLTVGEKGIVVGVQEHSPAFLQYLDKLGLHLGARLEITEIFEFDGSLSLLLNTHTPLNISQKVGENLLVQKIQ